ncbi:hypothetical protein [Roseicella aquatilis]|uniref:Uncharacterized protein n=1 Tax=Roseicella aquatilis TaxID=2527868 RepID=A0A4R4D4Z8_9PROT|nr:hypothetical protein [Roseicella aquatilis]TCZ53949.1 hypothetical protein EXY23_23955 [Roseicella aquatilis]
MHYRMAAPRCSVCLHPRKPEIDAALMAGAALIPTGQAFGVSKSALARHRTGCLAPKVAAAARMVAPASASRAEVERAKAIASGAVQPLPDDLLTLTGLLGRLARSLERLEAAADTSLAENAPTALAAVSAQLHRGIEAAAKMQGIYAEAAPPAAPAFSIVFKLSEAGERQPAHLIHVAQRPVGSVVDATLGDVQESEAGEDAADAERADGCALPVPGFEFALASTREG